MRTHRGPLLIVLATLALAFPTTDAEAATFVVTKTADTDDGVCDADCSLREAIFAANSSVAPKIQLSPGLYELTQSAAGPLTPTMSMTIEGSGAGAVVAGGASWAHPVFRFFNSVIAVTLRDLTIRNGSVPNATPDDMGGGIRVGQLVNLTLDRVVVEQNDAADRGGGISIDPGATVTLVDSVIRSNSSADAAGIYNTGTLIANGSSITDNQATSTGGGLYNLHVFELNSTRVAGNSATSGAGIYSNNPTSDIAEITDSHVDANIASNSSAGLWNALGTTEVEDTSFAANRASAAGGGVGVTNGLVTVARSVLRDNTASTGGGAFVNSGSLRLTDSTVSGNAATGNGGGVHVQNGASASITRTTIGNNRADSDLGTDGDGGGLFVGAATVFLLASILADNIDQSSAGNVHDDCSGTVASQGVNVIEDATGCSGLSGSDENADPQMSPLAFHGGPTQTHAIPAGSPAVGNLSSGDPACAGETDQRGVPRPIDGGCESGAYEFVECNDLVVNVVGTEANDTITGTDGPDAVLALGGNDTVSTLGGDDTVCAGSGNDIVRGGDGNDKLSGEAGADRLFGEAGTDTLNGGLNRDRCIGGRDRDTFAACEVRRQ
jgi:CSLREA domain-containing protein